MKKRSATLFLLAAALMALSGCDTKDETKTCIVAYKEVQMPFNVAQAKKELAELQRQYREAGTPKCCQRYIEKVINEGSDVLNLPAGVMDAGYADKDDAKKIAAYTVTLAGKKSLYPEYLQEGNMLYNGNCGGCHGDDGKGLNGAYPDLTLPLLKGAKIQKENVAKKIRELQERLEQEK